MPNADPDFLSEVFSRDPFPDLATFRRERPVHRHESSKSPCVSLFRYKHIVDVLRDDINFTMARPDRAGYRLSQSAKFGDLSFFQDPPGHTKIRRLLNPLFTQTRLKRVNESLVIKFRSLLNEARERGCVDLYNEVAVPFTVFGLCEFLGLPWCDAERFSEWGRIASKNEMDFCCKSGEMDQAEQELSRMYRAAHEYLHELFERSSAANQATVLCEVQSIVQKSEDTADSGLLIDAYLSFLSAGFDAVAMAFCNLVRCFIESPDQWQLLRTREELLKTAIEEALRFYDPIQIMIRTTKRPTRVHDTDLKPGDNILVWLGSANRDEDVFDKSHQFLINREPPIRHLGFGTGIHSCIGSGLGRLELKVMLQELLKSNCSFEPADDSWWEPNIYPMMFGPDACRLILR